MNVMKTGWLALLLYHTCLTFAGKKTLSAVDSNVEQHSTQTAQLTWGRILFSWADIRIGVPLLSCVS